MRACVHFASVKGISLDAASFHCARARFRHGYSVMARLGGRLTAKQVATLRPPKGKKRHDFADGRCLYLQTTVARDGRINRSWLLKYEIAFVGRREMGLGPTYDVSLAEARVRARFHRQQLRDGIDPLTAKRAARQALLAQK
jgi:hypothetical protein